MPTVLIVDDNPDERLIFSALLEHHGYSVLTSSDGVSAVAAARYHAPAVILMDVYLPDMSGLAATEMIRALPETSAIPVICVTAFDVTSAEARSAGCQRLLRKPVSPTQLISAVSSMLEAPGPQGWSV
jgi:CheY-like chemotaxis protein